MILGLLKEYGTETRVALLPETVKAFTDLKVEVGVVIVAIGFVALVLLGMWKWPVLIPAGYFLHGVWDLLHHPVKLGARVKKWYPPACIAYDWLVGAYIYIYMF